MKTTHVRDERGAWFNHIHVRHPHNRASWQEDDLDLFRLFGIVKVVQPVAMLPVSKKIASAHDLMTVE